METWLVVHPRWAEQVGATVAETLARVPVIAWRGLSGQSHMELRDGSGDLRDIPISPRMTVDDIAMLRDAALAGMGVAAIPQTYVAEDVSLGRLARLDFDLRPPAGIVHAVHLGQRGMRPAVRHLLDWLKKVGRSLSDGPLH